MIRWRRGPILQRDRHLKGFFLHLLVQISVHKTPANKISRRNTCESTETLIHFRVLKIHQSHVILFPVGKAQDLTIRLQQIQLSTLQLSQPHHNGSRSKFNQPITSHSLSRSFCLRFKILSSSSSRRCAKTIVSLSSDRS